MVVTQSRSTAADKVAAAWYSWSEQRFHLSLCSTTATATWTEERLLHLVYSVQMRPTAKVCWSSDDGAHEQGISNATCAPDERWSVPVVALTMAVIRLLPVIVKSNPFQYRGADPIKIIKILDLSVSSQNSLMKPI